MGDPDKKPARGQYDVARIPPRMLRGRLCPESFTLGGEVWTLEKDLKADFFASTGRYRAPDGRRACLKHYHTEPCLGIPLAWAGRVMCDREMAFYRRLAGVPGIPRLYGRRGRTGLIHEWIDGADLLDFKDRTAEIPDDFFNRLERLVADLHGRGVAYVDMNKPDNVLLGDDGRPYLVDFQISYRRPEGLLGGFGRWLFRVLIREDDYHVRKLKRKFRRDLMTEDEYRRSFQRSDILNLHRKIAHPFQRLRRWILKRLGAR